MTYFEYKGYFVSIEKDLQARVWTRASTTTDSIKQVFEGYPMSYVVRKIKKDINFRIKGAL
jgi:hypothetical protein